MNKEKQIEKNNEAVQETQKEQQEENVVVVKELPTQEVRAVIGEDGKTPYRLVTESEAMTEILRIVKKLERLV